MSIATPLKQSAPLDFAAFIREGGYDHIDFGCSKGGSLTLARDQFGGKRGLGIDIDPAKIEQTHAAGFDALAFNIHDIPDEKLVRFVILSHFLEHVPNPSDVQAFIKKACAIATDFVFIQQPCFDADGYLTGLGLKVFWSDWRGHPNPMSSLELWRMVRNLQRANVPATFSLHLRGLVTDSADPSIHPLASPVDQHGYDPAKHPPKPKAIAFSQPVFKETLCVISLGNTDHAAILNKISFDRTILTQTGEFPSANGRQPTITLRGMAKRVFYHLPKPAQHLIRRALGR